MQNLYYDKDGVPLTDTHEFARLFGDQDYKRVALSKLMDAANPERTCDVSTVWLGIDHSYGAGPPVIFETMVFAEGSSHDEACERYCTLAEAQQGHTAMVVAVAAEMGDPIVMEGEPLPGGGQ